MTKLRYMRAMLGISCLYACKRAVVRWQWLGLMFRRLAWRVAGRGSAPPITFAKHTYMCVVCHRAIVKGYHDLGFIAPPMIDDDCPRCRKHRSFGWTDSTVEIVR